MINLEKNWLYQYSICLNQIYFQAANFKHFYRQENRLATMRLYENSTDLDDTNIDIIVDGGSGGTDNGDMMTLLQKQ